jgi:hypothetical protein
MDVFSLPANRLSESIRKMETVKRHKNCSHDRYRVPAKTTASNAAGLSCFCEIPPATVRQLPGRIGVSGSSYFSVHAQADSDFFCAVLQQPMALLELSFASPSLFFS